MLCVVMCSVYLVTALVPSDTACLASSPGSTSRMAVWISRLDRVSFLLYLHSLTHNNTERGDTRTMRMRVVCWLPASLHSDLLERVTAAPHTQGNAETTHR